MSRQSEDERELLSRLRQISPSSETTARLRSRILAEVMASASVGVASGGVATAKATQSIGIGAKIASLVAAGTLLIGVGAFLGSRGSPHTSPPVEVRRMSPVVVRPPPESPSAVTPVSTAPAATASAPPHPAPTNSHGVGGGADLAEELRLIGQAQTAMNAGDFARALTALDAHRQRFPRGALASERAGLRVVALCRSGGVEAGRAEARRLLAASPGSTLSARIRAACDL